jgi:hypothetical protein
LTGPEALAELRRLIAAELRGSRDMAKVRQMLWSVYWVRLDGECSLLDELRIRRWQRLERKRPGLRVV